MLNNHIGIIEASFGDLGLNQKLFRVVNGADIRIAESIYNSDANFYHVLKDFDMDGIEAAARNRKKDGSYLLSDEQFKERYSVLNLDSLNTASPEYQSISRIPISYTES
jgi:hypothetical protein